MHSASCGIDWRIDALANFNLLDVQHLLKKYGPQPACVLAAQPTKKSPVKYLACHDNARGPGLVELAIVELGLEEE